MTDTHTHIYLTGDFPGNEAHEALDRALAAGVSRMIFPNVALDSVEPMLSLHDYSPQTTAVCAGLHPTELTENWEADWAEILRRLEGRDIIAVGETGIDLYRDSSNEDKQRKAFGLQANYALEKGLPLIIHCRAALRPTLEVLQSLPEMPAAVFHSFTGTPEDVKAILDVSDFYFGINGVVTFKNAQEVRDALKIIPRERILLETDAPWLSPVPLRGRRNESAYMVHTARAVAAILGMKAEEIERITDDNASRLFQIG